MNLIISSSPAPSRNSKHESVKQENGKIYNLYNKSIKIDEPTQLPYKIKIEISNRNKGRNN